MTYGLPTTAAYDATTPAGYAAPDAPDASPPATATAPSASKAKCVQYLDGQWR